MEITIYNAIAALCLGMVWCWSYSSNKLVRSIMSNDITVLPLWAFNKEPYFLFSIANLMLTITQFGLPLVIFLYLSLIDAVTVMVMAVLFSISVYSVIKILSKQYLMLNYILSAILTGVAVISFVALV